MEVNRGAVSTSANAGESALSRSTIWLPARECIKIEYDAGRAHLSVSASLRELVKTATPGEACHRLQRPGILECRSDVMEFRQSINNLGSGTPDKAHRPVEKPGIRGVVGYYNERGEWV